MSAHLHRRFSGIALAAVVDLAVRWSNQHLERAALVWWAQVSVFAAQESVGLVPCLNSALGYYDTQVWQAMGPRGLQWLCVTEIWQF